MMIRCLFLECIGQSRSNSVQEALCVCVILSLNQQGQVLGHDAVFGDGIQDAFLQGVGKFDDVWGVVQLTSLGDTSGPCKNGGNGVSRGFFACLVASVVSGDGTVGGLGFKRLSIWGDEDRSHQAKGAKTLGDDVGLDVTVVILESNDKATLGLQHLRHHVINQSVLVGDACFLEVSLVRGFVDLLENVFELAVVLLQDGVLCGEEQRSLSAKGHLERGVGKTSDGVLGVVHGQGHARALVVVHLAGDLLAARVFRGEGNLKGACLGDDKVGGLVLVGVGVSADDDGLFPAWHQSRNLDVARLLVWAGADDDWLSEDRTAEDVSYGSVWREPHLLQVELLHAGLIWSDGGTLHADTVLPDGVGRVDSDLVVRGVSGFDPEVVVLEVDVEVRQDELLLDVRPDNPRHLVSVQLHDRVFDPDLAQRGTGRGKVSVDCCQTALCTGCCRVHCVVGVDLDDCRGTGCPDRSSQLQALQLDLPSFALVYKKTQSLPVLSGQSVIPSPPPCASSSRPLPRPPLLLHRPLQLRYRCRRTPEKDKNPESGAPFPARDLKLLPCPNGAVEPRNPKTRI